MPTHRPKRRLYLASRNRHKLDELTQIIGSEEWQVHLATELDPNVSWIEDGRTFVDNAVIKAKTVKRLTGHCVLADDSGLEVAALSGKPGVYSQRYAGPNAADKDNNARLLREMTNVAEGNRAARFVCALAFIDESGDLQTFEDYCEGVILFKEQGDGGFGYDPLFLVPELGKTFGELTPEEKNRLSHRSRALARWRQVL